jgi:hypothetical protein
MPRRILCCSRACGRVRRVVEYGHVYSGRSGVVILAMELEEENRGAYIVLGPALVGAEVALRVEVFPTVGAVSKVFLMHATVEDACCARSSSGAGVSCEDMSALLCC